MGNKLNTISAIVLPSIIALPAFANDETVSGKIDAQLVLTSACKVDAGGSTVSSGGSFGVIDFGTQPGTFMGPISSVFTDGDDAETQITCTADLSTVNVTVDAGQSPNKGGGVGAGSRALASGDNYIPYEIYADSALATPYTANMPQAITISKPGEAFDLPIFGQIHKTGANALPAGTYTDELNVTISW